MGHGLNGGMVIAASHAAGKGSLLEQSPVIGTVLLVSVKGIISYLVDGRVMDGKKPHVLYKKKPHVLCKIVIEYMNIFFQCNIFVLGVFTNMI